MPEHDHEVSGARARDSSSGKLNAAEEVFIRAILWKEANLAIGPAYQALRDHRLDVGRLFDVVIRLDPGLQLQALPELIGPRPSVHWPWPGLTGEDVLRLLWERVRHS